MILDFITRINTGNYNLRLAKLFGINSAIFLSLLLDYYYVLKDKEEYIKLSRQEIYDLTAMNEDIQKQVEENLSEYNLIKISPLRNNSNKNYYKIDIELLTKIIVENNNDVEKALSEALSMFIKAGEAPRKVSKRTAIINNLKQNITLKDPQCLEYLTTWIDEVMQKSNYLSKNAVVYMCEQLQKYSGEDLNKLRDLCKVASIVVYKDPKWVIKKYEDTKQSQNNLVLNDLQEDEIKDNLEKLQNYEGETF